MFLLEPINERCPVLHPVNETGLHRLLADEGCLVHQAPHLLGLQAAAIGDVLHELRHDRIQEPAGHLPMGGCEICLRIHEARRLVITSARYLGTYIEFVQGATDERRGRRQPDQIEITLRIDHDLVARRCNVIHEIAGRKLARRVHIRRGPLPGGTYARNERPNLLGGCESATDAVHSQPDPLHAIVLGGSHQRLAQFA